MFLTRRNTTNDPIRDFVDAFTRDFNREFGTSPLVMGSGEMGFPMDISEHEGNLVIRANLPGFRKEDVNVHVQNGVLTIEARRSEEKETGSRRPDEQGEQFYRKERWEGSVVRRIELPSRFATSEPQADLGDGVLTLRFPESPEHKPRKIAIK